MHRRPFRRTKPDTRLHIMPGLGGKRLDKLTCGRSARGSTSTQHVPVLRAEQGRAAGPPGSSVAVQIGKCCDERVSERTAQDILMVLRSALSNAIREELTGKNPAALVRVSKPRKSRKVKPETVDEAQQFLASARAARDVLYAAYVLILVLGLRKANRSGLPGSWWTSTRPSYSSGEQVQRVGRRLLRREVKTERPKRRCRCLPSA